MSLRIALLGLLTTAGAASGYDLTKKFGVSINHVWQAQHSQIYPELVKMEADGLITVLEEGARGRKIYAITEDGSRTLREWMLDFHPTAPPRSETALHTFLLPLLETDEAIEAVTRLREHFATRLAQLESIPPAPEGYRFGQFALQLGLAQSRACLEWADGVIDQLKASSR
ncbi:PadR family transcriptional regulator [Nonomuraea sp. NPDC050556]|uniref:PadR family transcriptional regulator n=1 Tax=Nonomuraea sp. NPDC050556 TaxID=3364369 RepID=UPI0037B5A7D5